MENNVPCAVFDPLRKKMVRLTPEEKVRQAFIQALHTQYGVPLTHMMSEVYARFGSKDMRMDLIIYDKALAPVCIVECKEPSVKLDQRVMEQAIRYNLVINVPYICITNGRKTFVCRRNSEGRYGFISHFPTYGEMTSESI